MKALFTSVADEVVAFNMTVKEATKATPDQAFEASMKEMAHFLPEAQGFHVCARGHSHA